jgi:hypothetical protein
MKHALDVSGIHQPVFLDFRDLQPGCDWEHEIAEALCRSFTLVAFCGPDYYGSHFCSREWNSMDELANRRAGPKHGLILPVLVHPYEHIPPEIRKVQWLCDISTEIQTPHSNFRNSNWFRTMVKRTSDRVLKAHRALDPRLTGPCTGHALSKRVWEHKEIWEFPVL